MIISNDHKSIYIGIPKTGTRTVKFLLTNYGTVLGDHLTQIESLSLSCRKIENFDYKVVEHFYVIWRDPVDRFISAVNFLRANRPAQVLLKSPQFFSGSDYSSIISTTESGFRFIDGNKVSTELKESVKTITPEQIFDSHISAKENNHNLVYLVLEKQSRWISSDMTVLDYADFDTSTKTIMNAFGAPIDIQVPKLNESGKLTTSISPELEARVREYYAEDYLLKP